MIARKDSHTLTFNVPGRSCPSEAELAVYFENGLKSAGGGDLSEHVSNCEACLEQLAFLMDVTGNEPPPVPSHLLWRLKAPPLPERNLWIWGASGVVAACLVVAVGITWTQSDRPTEVPKTVARAEVTPAVPPAEQANSTRPEIITGAPMRYSRKAAISGPSLTMLVPRRNEVLKTNDMEFHWRSAESALVYDVTITAADGSLVWETEERVPTTRAPSSLRLNKDETYFVWVRAHFPDGKTVSSKPVPFSVTP